MRARKRPFARYAPAKPKDDDEARIPLRTQPRKPLMDDLIKRLLTPTGSDDPWKLRIEAAGALEAMEAVVEAARNVQHKPQNDEPYLKLQETLIVLGNKKDEEIGP